MVTKQLDSKQFNIPCVYVAHIPFAVADEDIYPESRAIYINACENSRVRAQRFYAWKLLEKVLKDVGVDMKSVNFECKNGRWESDCFYFSISHSDSVVAVAVGSMPIGIDVEKNGRKEGDNKLLNKILHKKENGELNGEFSRLWARKESAFKRQMKESFSPSQINTLDEIYVEYKLSAGSEEYNLCVSLGERVDVKIVTTEEILKSKQF